MNTFCGNHEIVIGLLAVNPTCHLAVSDNLSYGRVSRNTAPCTLRQNTCLGFNWISRKRSIHPMGRTDEGAKRPVVRRLRLLVVRCTRCARCDVSSRHLLD